MSKKQDIVKIKCGSGECFSSVLDLDIQLGDKCFKLGDLLAKELLLEDNLEVLKKYAEKEHAELLAKIQKVMDDEKVADDLLAKSVELLSKKIARIEQQINGGK